MKKIFQILLVAAVAAGMFGCYNDFDTPEPSTVYTDIDFASSRHITIAQLKQLYLDQYTLENNGSNSSWDDTKYVQITDEHIQSMFPTDYSYIEDIFIKGKVISNDEQGNIYKSLYLCDETGAIEVKLTTGISVDYPTGEFDRATGTMKSTWVYVKLKGLYVGNYRMMLSLGDAPTDSYNAVGEHKFYANSNIEDPVVIKQHVFRGSSTTLSTKGENPEIIEVTADTYESIFGENATDKLGRLVLLRDITCHYQDIGDNLFPSWMYTNVRPVVSKHWYTWAFNNKTYPTAANCYGSVLFSYIEPASLSKTLVSGLYTLRTSGYAQFAGRPIVRDGAKGDILALLALYSKSWTYSYGAYQLTINRYEDIMFDPEDFLSSEEVYAMTPNGYPNNIPDPSQVNNGYVEENDSYYTPGVEEDDPSID